MPNEKLKELLKELKRLKTVKDNGGRYFFRTFSIQKIFYENSEIIWK